MIRVLFCAVVSQLAIFNRVEAGCRQSHPVLDEGQLHGPVQGQVQPQEQQPATHEWLFNMGVLLQGTHGNICPGVGIKPSNRRGPVKVVTTASCIQTAATQDLHRLLASICDEIHEVALIPESSNQNRNVFVHPDFISAEETPQFDIAVVKFPRKRNTHISGDLNDWMQLPEQGFAPHAADGYSSVYWTWNPWNERRYVLKQRSDNLRVVDSVSHDGLFNVVGDLDGAITGAPLYLDNGGSERTVVGLYHSAVSDTHHQFISVGPHVGWIQGL